MTLQAGCRFAIAPHFHLPGDWTQRLSVGRGVAEEAGGVFVPRSDWRPPTPDELALLARSGDEPEGELQNCICLFRLPEHLGADWWDLLGRAAGNLGHGPLPDFDTFVSRAGEFLAFKGLPIPEGARCDAIVTDPAQRLVRWDREPNRPSGLHPSLEPSAPWPGAEAPHGPRVWGAINLEDESTAVVFINLPWERLGLELSHRFPDQSPPTTVGELAGRFLRCCPDYPPVRLTLGPGEGCRLPQGGLILVGSLEGKQAPDLLLLISQQTPPGSRSLSITAVG